MCFFEQENLKIFGSMTFLIILLKFKIKVQKIGGMRYLFRSRTIYIKYI